MRRKDFPFFKNNPGIAYLDNAATTQKPLSVINAEREFYLKGNANIKRGSYTLAERATENYENAREEIAKFLGAETDELAFFSGTTEAINAAATMMRNEVKRGDEILVGGLEHHSNFLPWKAIAEEKGARLRMIFPEMNDLSFKATDFTKELGRRTKIIAFAGTSNFTGFKWPNKEIKILSGAARSVGAYTLMDGAQSIQHAETDFRKLGVDFLAFSGHKIYAPMGTGGLVVRRSAREKLSPGKRGGEMVKLVRAKKIIYEDYPYILEAGTPNVGGAIALAEAIRYLKRAGIKKIEAEEINLTEYLLKRLKGIDNLKIYGPERPESRAPLVAFNLSGIHAHDVGYFLNRKKIAIRVGEHCAGPAHEREGIPASVRASLAFYNSKEEIDRLADALCAIGKKISGA